MADQAARNQANERSGAEATSARRGRSTPGIAVALAALFGASLCGGAATALPDCTSPSPGEPIFLSEGCVDPHYTEPYIDVDEERTTPVPHRYVHGGFAGTDTRFSIHFPPADQYEGRFFQNTHQLLSSENAGDDTIAFAIDSGGYCLQSNIGGNERCTTAECAVNGGLDPSIGGYRANAAAAQYSKVVAQEIYGPHRPHGYIYGGSGGAYQVIASAQNSKGVWDGFVPYVMGTPNSIPGVFTVRIHALRVLRQRNKFPEIMDAIDPGGSGNPYATLNQEESEAYREATRLGFPPLGWWNHATLTGGPLRLVAGYVPLLDAEYFDDFWTKPGYLGHDDPYGSVAAARIQDPVGARTVVAVNPPGLPGFIVLDSVPAGDLTGADLFLDSGASAGQQFSVFTAFGTALLAFGANVAPGDQVHIDNSGYLALQTYHRHQVPTRDMYGWNQFRKFGFGKPIYPQRDVLIGPMGAFNGAGSIQNGHFHGKMIAVENLLDIDAFPWQADWYRTKVIQAKGRKFEDDFRLYFTDHAQHTSPSPTNTAAFARTIAYTGVIEQALRDVSAWVESGVKPPASTRYRVDHETQVRVPSIAAARKGIQPVVHLWANGRERTEVRVGEPVTFIALVSTPPRSGKLVDAEWDFEGVGDYPDAEDFHHPRKVVLLKAQHTYTEPGTYFPVLRATSQKLGDPDSPFARVQNLGRVRVVVE